MALGVRVRLRDAATLDDLAEVTAPAPVQPGDVVASVDAVDVLEVVLVTPPRASCVPALARRLEKA
jgi:hypothetical protein